MAPEFWLIPGFAQKSAKPTNDNSPPIHRWDGEADYKQSVKRTAELSQPHISVVRFTDSKELTAPPSAEALGYSLSVRFANDEKYF